MIVVNFKRYPEGSGQNAVKLAGICKKLAQEYQLTIIPVPQAEDLPACTQLGIECWTQKFEPELKIQKGTLLNHSDYRLERQTLQEELSLSKMKGDKVCVCTETPEETVELLRLKPHFIAYEPPELIGSKTTSVAEVEPEIIGRAAKECQAAGIPLLVGAGIKSGHDVNVSLKQGAVGIVIASAVVQSENQEEKLRELAQAFSMRS